MKKTNIIVAGGLVGLAWSVVPLVLSELFRSTGETVSVLASGILTGITVTGLLLPLITLKRRLSTLAAGLLALPLGAFVFGVVISVVHLALSSTAGVSYRFIQYGFKPFKAGSDYALFSTLTVFGLVLVPLAVGTTFLLARYLNRSASAAAQSRARG